MYPHNTEKDYALTYMYPNRNKKKSRNIGVAASQSVETLKAKPLETIPEEKAKEKPSISKDD